MTMNSDLVLGYDYNKWYGYGIKQPIISDISVKCNSHTLICGMTGSGKSYATNIIFAKICNASNSDGIVYFADFKQDDQLNICVIALDIILITVLLKH